MISIGCATFFFAHFSRFSPANLSFLSFYSQFFSFLGHEIPLFTVHLRDLCLSVVSRLFVQLRDHFVFISVSVFFFALTLRRFPLYLARLLFNDRNIIQSFFSFCQAQTGLRRPHAAAETPIYEPSIYTRCPH